MQPGQVHPARILSLDWSPVGDSLVTGCGDDSLRRIDATDGRIAWASPSVTWSGRLNVAWSRSGTRIASAGHDGTLAVVNQVGTGLYTVPYGARVFAVAFNP